MLTDAPTVLYSIETAARELDSKLVLASALAKQGCRVVVAHKEIAHAIGARSRRVLWQGKSLFGVHSTEHPADVLARNESAIMFMSDEGAMYQADSWESVILQKHWVGHFSNRRLDRMCVWGERQAEVVAPHLTAGRSVVSVTGSARFDLCRPSYEWITINDGDAGKYPERPFILFCTRFGAVTHAKGMSAPFEVRVTQGAWPDSIKPAEIADLWFRKWGRDVHDFAEFAILIKEVARSFPSMRIVVRPHPSENIDFYRGAYASFDNIEIRREGNVLGWIRAAAVVVHSGSTSGVEAVLAGRPVVNYLPGTDRGDTDIEVAREAGHAVHTGTEAVTAIGERLSAEAPAKPWSARATSMLNNLATDAIPLLTEETMAVLRDARIEASQLVLPPVSFGLRARVMRTIGRDGYVGGKRGRLDAAHIERILDGCAQRGTGAGVLRHFDPRYAVIAPQ